MDKQLVEVLLVIAFGGVGLIPIRYFLERSRFRLSSSQPFKFTTKPKDPDADDITIIAEKIWFTNWGRKPVKNIEMIGQHRPAEFYFIPSVRYSEETLSNGKWNLRVETPLFHKQTIELYLLNAPILESYTSDEGPPRQTPVKMQRFYGHWFNFSVTTFFIIGIIVTGKVIGFDFLPWVYDIVIKAAL